MTKTNATKIQSKINRIVGKDNWVSKRSYLINGIPCTEYFIFGRTDCTDRYYEVSCHLLQYFGEKTDQMLREFCSMKTK